MTGHQIGHFGQTEALNCPIWTGHHRTPPDTHRTVIGQYRTPPSDSSRTVDRTFTGHSPDMTGHDRTVGHPGLRRGHHRARAAPAGVAVGLGCPSQAAFLACGHWRAVSPEGPFRRDREIGRYFCMHTWEPAPPVPSSFVSESVESLTQCVGFPTARSRLRTDKIMMINTTTVYIIDKDIGTKTAIVTDLPEAMRMVSLRCTLKPANDKEPK